MWWHSIRTLELSLVPHRLRKKFYITARVVFTTARTQHLAKTTKMKRSQRQQPLLHTTTFTRAKNRFFSDGSSLTQASSQQPSTSWCLTLTTAPPRSSERLNSGTVTVTVATAQRPPSDLRDTGSSTFCIHTEVKNHNFWNMSAYPAFFKSTTGQMDLKPQLFIFS